MHRGRETVNPVVTTDINLKAYSDPAVVSLYAKMEKLQPCEELIFQRWIRPGATVLDLGVGGGRTAGPLSKIAGRYIGIDYSQAMVEACRARYPQLEFRHGDATDLSQFQDGLFDAAVFSFNGIDYIRDDEGRAKCLSEVARVLKPGGVFVASSHNARAIGVWPQLKTARGARIPWRIIYSLYASARLAARSLSHAAFWNGSGYRLRPPAWRAGHLYVDATNLCSADRGGGPGSGRRRRRSLSGRASALADAVALLRLPQAVTGVIARS